MIPLSSSVIKKSEPLDNTKLSCIVDGTVQCDPLVHPSSTCKSQFFCFFFWFFSGFVSKTILLPEKCTGFKCIPIESSACLVYDKR